MTERRNGGLTGIGTTQGALLGYIRRKGSASRVELADHCNITPAAVSMMTRNLLERGIIVEGARRQEGRGAPHIDLLLKKKRRLCPWRARQLLSGDVDAPEFRRRDRRRIAAARLLSCIFRCAEGASGRIRGTTGKKRDRQEGPDRRRDCHADPLSQRGRVARSGRRGDFLGRFGPFRHAARSVALPGDHRKRRQRRRHGRTHARQHGRA